MTDFPLRHLEPAVLLSPEKRVGADADAWRAGGGGAALARALDLSPEAVRATVAAADLRGMGGAGFPAARKWDALAAARGEKIVLANGNEDEPGTFKDRALMTLTPLSVIEGALIAARATGARRVVLYVNGHRPDCLSAMRAAAAIWRGEALLHRLGDVLGGPVNLRVHAGRGQYAGGEETGACADAAGGFPFPRRKPPYPTDDGVAGHPTLVNNVETLAQAVAVFALGPAAYAALGRGRATGTKLYSLSGDVLRPGLYELPAGTPLRDLIFRYGGGMLPGLRFKAVFTGGPSNTLLTAAEADTALDFDSLRDRGARLGTGAMIVVSEGTGIVRRVADYVGFFAAGSCGQCVSCRTGTRQMAHLLERLDAGRGTAADLEALDDLCALLPGSGRCGLVDAAATVVASSLHRFGDEYRRQIWNGVAPPE